MIFNGNTLDFQISAKRGNFPTDLIRGKCCFILTEGQLFEEVKSYFGRSEKNLCLKVFYDPALLGSLDDYYWGDAPDEQKMREAIDIGKVSKLQEAIKIQNMCAMERMAPRVFGLVIMEQEGLQYACALQEYVQRTQETTEKALFKTYDRAANYLASFGCLPAHRKMMSPKDIINGNMIVDLQGFRFGPMTKDKITSFYVEKCRYGKVYYQSVPELGLRGGPRNSLDRIKYMQLDRIDFVGKSVIDIGCAGGFFCRYADSRGAKRVLGIDMEQTLIGTRHLSNYLGNYNIDYAVRDLAKPFDGDVYDIAFFLSLNFHVPIPEIVKKAKMVVFEDNGKETKNLTKLGKPWTDCFSKIEFVGRGEDHGNKSVYHLYK